MATIIGSGLEGYLHRQARKRALNLIAEAQEEARRTLEQATLEIEALRQRIRAETERAIDDRRRRTVAQARLQSRLLVTNRVEEVLAELWERAEEALRRCADGEPEGRRALIARLTRDAAAQLGDGTLELAMNAADRPLLTPEFLQALGDALSSADGATRLVPADEEAPIRGGVIVYRRRTNQLVDNSLEERLALVRRTMRDEVSRLLAPADDPQRRHPEEGEP